MPELDIFAKSRIRLCPEGVRLGLRELVKGPSGDDTTRLVDLVFFLRSSLERPLCLPPWRGSVADVFFTDEVRGLGGSSGARAQLGLSGVC